MVRTKCEVHLGAPRQVAASQPGLHTSPDPSLRGRHCHVVHALEVVRELVNQSEKTR